MRRAMLSAPAADYKSALQEMHRRHAFCSGTPPRSEGGCGGQRAPLPSAREAAPLQGGECRAAAHFVAERLRVPRGDEGAAEPAPVGAGSRAATKRRMRCRHAFCSGTPPRSEGAGEGGGPRPRRRGKPRRYKEANAAPPRILQRNASAFRPGVERAAGPTSVGAGSRAAAKRRMPRRHAFCSGTPPRSDRGCGGLRAPLPPAREAAPLQRGECAAAAHFVAERLRVPRGGGKGCGARPRRRGKPRRYKEANASPPRIL